MKLTNIFNNKCYFCEREIKEYMDREVFQKKPKDSENPNDLMVAKESEVRETISNREREELHYR